MRAAVLSSARWSSMWLSKHHVARALADKGHDVLYVDPPLSPLSLVRQPERGADLRAASFQRVDDRLGVWRPRVLPGQNSRFGQRVNARLLERGIRAHLGRPDATIAFSLEARTVFDRLGGTRVYYCTDSAEDQPGVDRDTVAGWEQQLVRRADVVVACSLPLADQLASRGASPVYIPHACASDDFSEAAAPLTELLDRPRPWIGYVGSINFRVDVRLLEAVLEACGGTIVIIGGRFGARESAEFASFVARRDVLAVGHIERHRLPSHVATLDVGLVPYTATPFNRKSFPLKVLQYLAAGVPVVSTTNGATDEIGSSVDVRIEDDVRAFARAAADLAHAPATGDARRRRQAMARSRTWNSVVDQLLAALQTT